MTDSYWLYAIECVPTGQIYVGLTGGASPCWRWATHFVELSRGSSTSQLFQEAWNCFSDWKNWSFRILGKAEGKRDAHHKEAQHILNVPKERRLNSVKTSTLSLERRGRVEELLAQGRRYEDIRDEVGVSMGTISKIKKDLNHA